jgi:hypothetical protein
MQLLKISVSSVFVWIKLHNLPMEFWNATCLSYVASGVGKPLCADTVTEEQLRLGFARVLVEVNIDSDFPKEVEIVGVNGQPVVVGIEYPWIPLKCKKCKSFGHASHACTRVEKSIWIPKKPDQVKKAWGVERVSATCFQRFPSHLQSQAYFMAFDPFALALRYLPRVHLSFILCCLDKVAGPT